MIDRSKNLCYVITVHYYIEDGASQLKPKTYTFISLHGSSSKKCMDFVKKKICDDPRFRFFAEDCMTQRTIPLEDYCK